MGGAPFRTKAGDYCKALPLVCHLKDRYLFVLQGDGKRSSVGIIVAPQSERGLSSEK